VVWDPHVSGPSPVVGVDVVTPNAREAAHFAPTVNGRSLRAEIERARFLRRSWDVGAVAVTRDRDGAVLVTDQVGVPLVIPVTHVSGFDSSGAGDRLAVSLTCALATGLAPAAALAQAVGAASTFVASGHRKKASSRHGMDEAVDLASRVRASGGTVVATGGCFDLLHRGHIATLKAARALGDCLIVCVNSDSSVSRVKGAGRPVVCAEDRAEILSGLTYVDAVIVFEEDTPSALLSRIRPHIWVKGGDYELEEIVEQTQVEAAGGHVVIVPYLGGKSTTSLIELAVRRYASRSA
jgi:D-beta-D-heptose 7-phosphate kinase/D-beta-D-heptose 1-phosphate adenosyltransferase